MPMLYLWERTFLFVIFKYNICNLLILILVFYMSVSKKSKVWNNGDLSNVMFLPFPSI